MAIQHAFTFEKFGEPMVVPAAYTSIIGAHCQQEAANEVDETGKVILVDGKPVLKKRWVAVGQVVTHVSAAAKWNRGLALAEKFVSVVFDPNTDNPLAALYAEVKRDPAYAGAIDV